MMNAQTVGEQEITIERVFNAPLDLVWSVWSDPEHLKNWWGPFGFTNTFEEFEFHTGGNWRFVMHGSNGVAFPNHNLFVEIQRPNLLVIDHLENPRFRMTVTFEELGEQTRILFRQAFESVEAFEAVKPYAIPGGQQTFDKLADYLS